MEEALDLSFDRLPMMMIVRSKITILLLISKKETAHDMIQQQLYRQKAIQGSLFIDNSNNRRRFKARLLDSVRRPVEAYLVHNSMSEALKTSLLVERIQEPC